MYVVLESEEVFLMYERGLLLRSLKGDLSSIIPLSLLNDSVASERLLLIFLFNVAIIV